MDQLRTVDGHAARRLGEAVHQVHPPHRALADPAGRYDPDHRRRQDRRRRRQRRALGRARRWWPGHREDLRRPHGRADPAARAGPRHPVQLAVPRPVPVEAAGRRKAPGAEGPSVRCAHRRRRRHRRYPRTRRGRRPDRGTQRDRHHPRGVQAGHRRPDQVRHQDRHRGSRQARSSPTSRAAAPVATTRGRTSTTCCWPPTPICASCPTSPSASAAASAPRARRRVPVRPLGRGTTASR